MKYNNNKITPSTGIDSSEIEEIKTDRISQQESLQNNSEYLEILDKFRELGKKNPEFIGKIRDSLAQSMMITVDFPKNMGEEIREDYDNLRIELDAFLDSLEKGEID